MKAPSSQVAAITATASATSTATTTTLDASRTPFARSGSSLPCSQSSSHSSGQASEHGATHPVESPLALTQSVRQPASQSVSQSVTFRSFALFLLPLSGVVLSLSFSCFLAWLLPSALFHSQAFILQGHLRAAPERFLESQSLVAEPSPAFFRSAI